MRPVDLSPIAEADQTERPFDLFLIFVGANIVATTLQVGASLPPGLGIVRAIGVIAAGACAGAALVALLAPIGSTLRVPSIVALRAPLGFTGAQTLALLLFLTNFAWIALNNVIAASICTKLTGVATPGVWATTLGILATLVVLGGPKTAAIVDRAAVPVLLASGVVFTLACVRAGWPALPAPAQRAGDVVLGFDVVAGYQVTWLLMFADYPRYVRSPGGARTAVFLGLSLTALWFMPLGLFASAYAQSSDPGAMVYTLGLGWWGASLLSLAALTTNFVNIYMSALAFKSLRPEMPDAPIVWLIGGVGAALGLLSNVWIEQFAAFTLLLAGLFVPIGGILLAHYFVLRIPVYVPELYNPAAQDRRWGGWTRAGLGAWIGGAIVFYLAQPIGGSVPSLLASMALYACLRPRSRLETTPSSRSLDPRRE